MDIGELNSAVEAAIDTSGLGIERGFVITQFNAYITDDYGFSATVWIPDEMHSDTHGNGYQENMVRLAENFFDGMKGPWGGWEKAVLKPSLEQACKILQRRIVLYKSREAEEIRKQYKREISKYRKTTIIRRYCRANHLPDPEHLVMSHIPRKHQEHIRKLQKAHWDMMNANSRRLLLMYGDFELADLLENPFAFIRGWKDRLKDLEAELREVFVDIMKAEKSPDISNYTKAQRRKRGNPKEPPLYETGEFADSVRVHVEEVKLKKGKRKIVIPSRFVNMFDDVVYDPRREV